MASDEDLLDVETKTPRHNVWHAHHQRGLRFRTFDRLIR